MKVNPRKIAIIGLAASTLFGMAGCGKNEEPDVYGAPIPTNITEEENMIPTVYGPPEDYSEDVTEDSTEKKTEDTTAATEEKSEEKTESVTEDDTEEVVDETRFSDSIQIDVSDDKVSTYFNAFDTDVSMSFYGADTEEILKDSIDIIDSMDKAFNTVRKDSDVAALNNGEQISSDIFTNGEKIAKEYKESADGDFDIAVKSGENQFDTIEFGKGYTENELLKYLQNKEELSAGLISIGGNTTLIGSKTDGKPWKIGIQDPDKPLGEHMAVVKIEGLSSGETMTVATGGIYGENNGARDVIDPHTGKKAESDIVSATVVSSNPIDAAVISTVLVVKGYDKAIEFWRSNRYDFDMILIDSDKNIFITDGLEDCFSSDITPDVITK
jgi:Membrane-associated lipoprotein involved in thiamine biosynthesis